MALERKGGRRVRNQKRKGKRERERKNREGINACVCARTRVLTLVCEIYVCMHASASMCFARAYPSCIFMSSHLHDHVKNA